MDSFPWLTRLVTLVRVTQSGQVTQAKTDGEKRAMLGQADDSDLLLAAWPGEWSQDVFFVDDLKAARLAVGLPRNKVVVSSPQATESVGWERPSDWVPPGNLWRCLAELPELPAEGRRQIVERYSDAVRSDVVIALLARDDLDQQTRQSLLDATHSWTASDLIASKHCATAEATALLTRFATSPEVILAALRRPDTKEAALQQVGRMSYARCATLWLDTRTSSKQAPELASAVLQVVLTATPETPANAGYRADQYDQLALIRSLTSHLPDDERVALARHPQHGPLVQRAWLAGTDLTDDELVECLPEVTKRQNSTPPPLLDYVQRFPRLIELAGELLREAAGQLMSDGWSPEQAAQSGRWATLVTAARIADDPELLAALVKAAVVDTSPTTGAHRGGRTMARPQALRTHRLAGRQPVHIER